MEAEGHTARQGRPGAAATRVSKPATEPTASPEARFSAFSCVGRAGSVGGPGFAPRGCLAYQECRGVSSPVLTVKRSLATSVTESVLGDSGSVPKMSQGTRETPGPRQLLPWTGHARGFAHTGPAVRGTHSGTVSGLCSRARPGRDHGVQHHHSPPRALWPLLWASRPSPLQVSGLCPPAAASPQLSASL